jgi:hypothetical protein
LEESDRIQQSPHSRAEHVQAPDDPHASRPADRQQRDDAPHDDHGIPQRAARETRDAVNTAEPRFEIRNLRCNARAL